jgi:HEAT repeat protein
MTNGEEYLEQVDWSSLLDAYDDSVSLPNVLLKLASNDYEERKEALDEVNCRLVHQGSRFSASSRAVPFLLFLAKTGVETASILELLSQIAVGEDHEYLSGTINPYLLRRDATRPPCPSAGPAKSQITPDPDELAAYDAVKEGVPLFIDLLKGDDRQIRIWAAYILGFFPERREEIVPILADVLEGEIDSQVAATVAISSGLVSLPNDPRLSIALERRLHGRHRVERWGAAIGLEWWSHCSDPLVRELLQDCISSRGRSVTEVPFYNQNIDTMASLANNAYRRRQWD